MEEQITPNLTKLFTKTMYQNIMMELLFFMGGNEERIWIGEKKSFVLSQKSLDLLYFVLIQYHKRMEQSCNLQLFHYLLSIVVRPLEMQLIYKDFAASPRCRGGVQNYTTKSKQIPSFYNSVVVWIYISSFTTSTSIQSPFIARSGCIGCCYCCIMS